MTTSIAEFWQLLEKSQLVAPEFCKSLAEQFGQLKGVSQQGNANVLAEWVVSQQAITRYQAKVLLSGRSGPFFYADYVLYDKISEGPLNGCYRAAHTQLRHPVLLSFLDDSTAMNPDEWLAAGSQVLHAAQWVGHPHLHDLYQVIELGKKRVAVLSDVNGTSLDKMLTSAGRLAPQEACRIVREVLLALNTLHQTGSIHGAVRPANIVVQSNNGQAVLLQPPVARSFSPIPGTVDLSPYTTDQLLPQIDYMAPELSQAGVVANPTTDIYAVGCLLYQLLSGHPPFPGGDIGAKFVRHASEPVQPLEPYGVPPQLAQVVMYAMAKDTSLRYPTAVQLAEALTYFVEPRALQIVPQPLATLHNYLGWLHQQPRLPGELERQLHEGTSADAPATTSFAVNLPGHDLGASIGVKSNWETVDSTADAVNQSSLERIAAQKAALERSQLNKIIAAAAAVFVLFIAFMIYRSTRPEEVAQPEQIHNKIKPTIPVAVTPVEPIPTPKSVTPPVEPQPKTMTQIAPKSTGGEDPTPSSVEVIADDGQALWASPTSGAALKFDELPAGAQVFFSVRPWDLLNKNRFNPKLFAALGPLGDWGRKKVEAELGLGFNDLTLLQVAWVEADGKLTPVYYARARDKASAEQWKAKLKNPPEEIIAGKTAYRGPQLMYHWPAADNGLRMIATYPAQMKELLEAPSLANPRVARILARSDETRLMNFICNPAYLFQEGPRLLPGQDNLFKTLEKVLDYDTAAVGVSLHLDEQNFFTELRMLPGGSQTPDQAARLYRDKLKNWQASVTALVGTIMKKQPHQYGVDVLLGFAPRVAKFNDLTRAGEDQGVVVLRTYLNPAAAEHLVLASELALAYTGSAAGAIAQTGSVSATNTATQVLGDKVEDKLKKVISLTFDRDTLEKTMVMLSDEIGVPIEILGGDLQLDGITKNQSFALDEKNKPAGEILRTIMLKANPDGKLVYLIKPKAAGQPDILFITTRAQVAKRGDKLPPELEQPKAPPAKK